MTARRLHRLLAFGLGLFLLAHLGNHLAGLWGQAAHGAVQGVLRGVYRHPLVEPLLLAAVAAQAGLGLRLLARSGRLTLQSLSGAWLALFLSIHLGAVLLARAQGTETDLAFAAAGLLAPAPWSALMAVYYGLAILAFFAHLSVPLSRRSALVGHATLAFGAALSLTLVALLAGRLTPLTIPPALVAAFP